VLALGIWIRIQESSVVDPNRLCSYPDPDPGPHLHSDPGSGSGAEQDPNKFGSGSDLNL